MRFIVGGRGGGKTYDAIRWLKADENRVLVVASHQHRISKCEQYGEELWDRIWTVEEVVSGRARGMLHRPVWGVDDLDMVLPQLLGGAVDLVTGTGGVKMLHFEDNPCLDEATKERIRNL